jgi:DNA-binding transcriptional LysR family regulator
MEMPMMRLGERVAGVEEFVRVAELSSFVRAAETLALSTSGLSKAIRQLEARLNVRLLNRTTRRVALTDEGAAFLARIKQLLSDFDDAEGELVQATKSARGLLRVDMPIVYGRLVVLPRLPAFFRRHPNLTIEARLNDHHIFDLIEDGIDVAVRIGSLDDSTLMTRQIGRLGLATYAAPSYIERCGAPKHPSELVNHAVVAFSDGRGPLRKPSYVIDGTPWNAEPGGISVAFNDGEAMTDAAKAGLGITQVTTLHAAPAVAEGTLVQVLTGWDGPGPPIQLVHASGRHMPLRVRVFIDFLRQCPDPSIAPSRT